jgi:hypothetical protein
MGQVFLNDLKNLDDIFSNQRDDKTRNPDMRFIYSASCAF